MQDSSATCTTVADQAHLHAYSGEAVETHPQHSNPSHLEPVLVYPGTARCSSLGQGAVQDTTMTLATQLVGEEVD